MEGISVRPLTVGCAAALARADHACVGVSPFNGYFTPPRIAWLAEWALGAFDAVHFFVPDGAAAHTLRALGYPPERAAHKARRQGAYVKNKIRRALADLGVGEPDDLVWDSARLEASPVYTDRLADAWALYGRDPDFRMACLRASRWVLDGRLPDDDLAPERLELAARYFVAELPLFADSVGIAGRGASVFCYHQSPPFLRLLYRRELQWRPRDGQGFAVVTPDGQAAKSRVSPPTV